MNFALMNDSARRVLALLAVVSVAAACGSGTPADPGGAVSGAHISVINGAPGAVRVVVDGATRIESLSAASVSTAIDVGAGSHTVELQAIAGGALSGTSAMQVATTQSATAFV
ncbi:MAG TPA: hypothetical protein VGI97_11295, partial [Gemmatimonadaceae bacterium]